MRRASEWAAFIDCEAHTPRTTTPSTAPPRAATMVTAMTTGSSIFVLPSGREATGGSVRQDGTVGSYDGMRPTRQGAPLWARNAPFARLVAAIRGDRMICA